MRLKGISGSVRRASDQFGGFVLHLVFHFGVDGLEGVGTLLVRKYPFLFLVEGKDIKKRFERVLNIVRVMLFVILMLVLSLVLKMLLLQENLLCLEEAVVMQVDLFVVRQLEKLGMGELKKIGELN